MVCPACIPPIALLVAIIVAILYFFKVSVGAAVCRAKKWACRGPGPKIAAEPPTPNEIAKAQFVRTSPVPMGTEIRPPIGPTKDVTFTDEERLPGPETEPQMFMPLPKGGLSCPNKRWYDSIYNGGVATEIAVPGIEEDDMKRLWRKDYRSLGYNGQFAWGDDREPRAIDEGRPWRNMNV